jgi:plastocyanin
MKELTTINRTILLACLPLLLCSGTAAGDGDAGTVRGQIAITRPDRDDDPSRNAVSNRYYSRSERPPQTAAGRQAPRYTLTDRTVVYLEADGDLRHRIASVSGSRVLLDQRHLMFFPHVLAVQQGTTVVFPNNDDVFHNVFSYSQPKQFDLGRYPRGQFRTVRFDTPGVVRIYCDIHAHMNAVILVLENPYFTAADENGNFVLPDVPSGRYMIHFWFGRNLVESRPIEVRPNGVTNVRFIY